MTNVMLILTTMGLLVCALAMTALLRQIGLISRRMVDLGKGGRPPGLEIGKEIPTRVFELADGSEKLNISADGDRPTALLFASLSCALCRSLLEGLRTLDPEILDSTVLMLLDSGPWSRFSPELRELGLGGISVVFAAAMAGAFEISMPPQVYVVDGDLRIVAAGRVFTAEELAKMIAEHIGIAERDMLSDIRKENRLEKQTIT